MDNKVFANKKFPECAIEALKIIRMNHKRYNKPEMAHLAYNYILYCEFDKDKNNWIKVIYLNL